MGRELQFGEDMVNEESVDAPIAVIERVDENETEGGGTGDADGVDLALGINEVREHPHPAIHK